MKTFADFDIEVDEQKGPELYTTCPHCSPTRKKKKARCLAVNTDKGVWLCHHCDWRGSLNGSAEYQGTSVKKLKRCYEKPHYQASEKGCDQLLQWFKERGIPVEIVRRNQISLGREYMPQLEEFAEVIQFPYIRKDEVINIKYRTLEDKFFRQTKGAEKIFYGLDDLTEDWAVIVEGELDKLALEAAGITNAVSVPDGAPPENSRPSEVKFEYLQNCEKELGSLNKFILAVDNDGPGAKLAEELARRLGPERCWRVQYLDDCKDGNEILLKYGAGSLREMIEQATPWPIDGVVEVEARAEEVLELYDNGWPGGVSTGWASVDEYYTVRAGELTVVTGIPGHGKTEFLDALAVNLAVEQDWVIGVCSPENWPIEGHLAKLIEKHSGFPFGEGPNLRLPKDEVVKSLQWLQEHLIFFSPPEDQLTIDHVLTLAKRTVFRYGIKGLILDPWNEFDHSRPSTMTETEYISQSLTKIRRFARNHQLHVWVVAHPAKLNPREDGTYPVPTPYHISGSAHWRNKADNCITVYRDVLDESQFVEIHIQKIRFRQVGRVGKVELEWNPVNGQFATIPADSCVEIGHV